MKQKRMRPHLFLRNLYTEQRGEHECELTSSQTFRFCPLSHLKVKHCLPRKRRAQPCSRPARLSHTRSSCVRKYAGKFPSSQPLVNARARVHNPKRSYEKCSGSSCISWKSCVLIAHARQTARPSCAGGELGWNRSSKQVHVACSM